MWFKCAWRRYRMWIFYSHFLDSLLVYKNKCYLPVYLDNCFYKLANKQMTGFLDENVFWRLDIINAIELHKLITIELIKAKKLILLNVTTVKNVWYFIIGFSIMVYNINILYAMVLIIVALFITLANMNQWIY